MLSDVQIDRYARHVLLPEIGGQGQEKLLDSKILIIGAGGLGSPAALYLTAAGVGQVGLVDFDAVDRSNLQRQILYTEADVDQAKVDVAVARLQAVNPDVTIAPYSERLGEHNASALIRDYDVVIDGSDNFDTRYLVNDVCVRQQKPNVYGSVLAFEGQASLFVPGGPCYRCVFPHPPPEGTVPVCAEAGVLGPVAGLIAMIQASEALKCLLHIGDSLAGRLLLIDALHMQIDEVHVEKTPNCATCGAPAEARS